VTWLGFPGTSGLGKDSNSAIDYMITDSLISPPELVTSMLSESSLHLPHSYQPQDELQSFLILLIWNCNYLVKVVILFVVKKLEFKSREEVFDYYGKMIKKLSEKKKEEEVLPLQNDQQETILPSTPQPEHSHQYRSLLNISTDSFVFGCLNRNGKILPTEFSIWMHLLKRVPNSVLLLYRGSEEVVQNLLVFLISFNN